MYLKSLRTFSIFILEEKSGLEPQIRKKVKLYLSQRNLLTQRTDKAGKTIQPSTPKLGCWVTASWFLSVPKTREGMGKQAFSQTEG